MNLSNHTPGPWESTDICFDNEQQPFWSVVDGLNRVIAQTCCPVVNADHRANSPYLHAVAKANAHLIAAAPQLLAACQSSYEELWQLHEQTHPTCIADRPKRCPSRAALEECRAALAAATGQKG